MPPNFETPGRLTTRRDFVKTSALAAGVLALPNFIRAQQSDSPANKLNVACIGVGGKGKGDVADVDEHANLVAMCDVDFEGDAAKTVARFPGVPLFTDYREMFDKMGGRIDAVTVSTPDHSHYPALMMAMALGQHVFSQKPLSNSIWEARQLLLASRHHKVVTQMGIQGHTYQGMRLLKEWLEVGAIGDVQQVRYWTNRPIWPQGPEVTFEPGEKPDSVNWDVWQGTVVPERPYSVGLHPKKWRASWDYGCGALGDIGCHLFDAAFWALDLGVPDEVAAEAVTPFDDRVAPAGSVIRYKFTRNSRGETIKPVELLWSDGDLRPSRPAELEPDSELHKEFGQILTGTRGKIYSPGGYCESLRIIPKEAMLAFERPPQKYTRVRGGPMLEWLDAIRNGTQPGANFEYSSRLTEVVLLGNLAIRLGRPIRWDSANLKVIGAPEADPMIKRQYREGWEFPIFEGAV
jgi:predicted dehydrogenase